MFSFTFLTLAQCGINVQASCIANCCFKVLGIGGPGVSKDCNSTKGSVLSDKNDSFFLVESFIMMTINIKGSIFIILAESQL